MRYIRVWFGISAENLLSSPPPPTDTIATTLRRGSSTHSNVLLHECTSCFAIVMLNSFQLQLLLPGKLRFPTEDKINKQLQFCPFGMQQLCRIQLSGQLRQKSSNYILHLHRRFQQCHKLSLQPAQGSTRRSNNFLRTILVYSSVFEYLSSLCNILKYNSLSFSRAGKACASQ